MAIILESRDHLEQLTHLKQVQAEFVSIVPHAANRIPFKFLKFDESEARDENGRWTSGGASGDSGTKKFTVGPWKYGGGSMYGMQEPPKGTKGKVLPGVPEKDIPGNPKFDVWDGKGMPDSLKKRNIEPNYSQNMITEQFHRHLAQGYNYVGRDGDKFIYRDPANTHEFADKVNLREGYLADGGARKLTPIQNKSEDSNMSLEVIHAIVQPSGKDVAALKGLYGEDWFNHVKLSDKIENESDGSLVFVQKAEADFEDVPFVLRDAGHGITFKSGWLKKNCKGDADILPIPTKNTKGIPGIASMGMPGDDSDNVTVNVSVTVPIPDNDNDDNDNVGQTDTQDEADTTPDLPTFTEEFQEQTSSLACAISGIVEVVQDVDTKKKMIADLLSSYGTTLNDYMDKLASGDMIIDEEDEDESDMLMGKSEKADLSAPDAARALVSTMKKGVANLKARNQQIRQQTDDAVNKIDVSKNPKAIKACQDVKAALDASDQSLDTLATSLGNVTETELSKVDPAKAAALNKALQHLRVVVAAHKDEKADSSSFDEKAFMSACMHDQEKTKGKTHDQCVAICMNMAKEGVPYSETHAQRAEQTKAVNAAGKADENTKEKFDDSQPRAANGQWAASGESGQALNAAITGVAGGAAAGVASGLMQSPGGVKAAAAAAHEARNMAGTALKIAGAVGVAGLVLSGVGIPIAVGAASTAAFAGGLAAAGVGAAATTAGAIGAVHYAPIYAKTVIADRLLTAAANAKKEKAEKSAQNNTIEIGDIQMTPEEVKAMVSEAVKEAMATKSETDTATEKTSTTTDQATPDETAALKAELEKKEAEFAAIQAEIEALKTKNESLQHSAGHRMSSAEVNDPAANKNQKRDGGAGPLEGFFSSL